MEAAIKLGSQEDLLRAWLLRKTCQLEALTATLLPVKNSSACTAVCMVQSHRSWKHACLRCLGGGGYEAEAEHVCCGESHVSHGREVLASSRRMAQIDNKGRHLEHIPHESQRRQRARTPSGLEWQDEPMPKYTPHPFLGFSVPSPAEMTQSRTK